MTAHRVLTQFRTSSDTKVSLELFTNAPLASLTIGNRHKAVQSRSAVIDVDDARRLLSALTELVVVLDARNAPT